MRGKSKIVVLKVNAEPTAIDRLIEQCFQCLDEVVSDPQIFTNKRILVKPNLCGDYPNANTNPYIIYGIVKWIERFNPSKLIVGDSAYFGKDTEEIIRYLKIREILKETKAEVVDFKKSKLVEVPFENGIVLKKAWIPSEVLESDILISVAKLKTISDTIVSLCIKNLHGILPDQEKLRAHYLNVHKVLVDLLSKFKPTLSIIDAIEGLDMDNPINVNLLIGGTDTVAVDAIGTMIMGFKPEDIWHLRLANEYRLGNIDSQEIEIYGEVPTNLRFEGPPRSLKAIKIPRQIEVIDGNPCPGCIGKLNQVLRQLEEQNMSRDISSLKLLVGPMVKQRDYGKNVIVLGSCLEHMKHLGHYIHGCSPLSRDIRNSLLNMGRKAHE
jgi:uncharacterized protein (DUF362 family)